MMAFSDSIYIGKLKSLNKSSEAISRLSQWMIFYRKEANKMAKLWKDELEISSKERKIAMLYLCNDVLQLSRKKGNEFLAAFSSILPDSIKFIIRSEPDATHEVSRVLEIWESRRVYPADVLSRFREEAGLASTSDYENLNMKRINSLNSAITEIARANEQLSKLIGNKAKDDVHETQIDEYIKSVEREEGLRSEIVRELSVLLGQQKTKLERAKRIKNELNKNFRGIHTPSSNITQHRQMDSEINSGRKRQRSEL